MLTPFNKPLLNNYTFEWEKMLSLMERTQHHTSILHAGICSMFSKRWKMIEVRL